MQKSNKVIISCGMALYFFVWGGLQWQKNLMKACKFLQGNMSVLQSSMDKRSFLKLLTEWMML